MNAGVPSPQEISVFEIQAYMDLTKHIGSLQATDELARLCQIGPGQYVLDVGCGVGATPAYLARQYGCRVVGVDISPAMIERARERAAREVSRTWSSCGWRMRRRSPLRMASLTSP